MLKVLASCIHPGYCDMQRFTSKPCWKIVPISSKLFFMTEATPAEEVAKFNAALEKTKSDIEGIKERAAKRLAPEELAVFDAHLMMAGDPCLQN